MKIVVTGIAGFLGSLIGEALINKRHELARIVMLPPGILNSIGKKLEQKLEHTKIKYVSFFYTMLTHNQIEMPNYKKQE